MCIRDSTYDTCYRAGHVFEIESAILVTQAFHLPRALLTDVYKRQYQHRADAQVIARLKTDEKCAGNGR